MSNADRPLPPPVASSPSRSGAGGPWYRRSWVLASVALTLGLALGTVVGFTLADTDGDGNLPRRGIAAPTTSRQPTTTTTSATLSAPCAEAVRSAEQALALLQEGVQVLQAGQLLEVQSVLEDIQSVRRDVGARVRECLERTGS